ncbi:GNAT family protein [Cecembia sp.]|uniref:GNAT family N-acetyltransferase n=1 Tax=Cecembia sp. TaxID=1898110 RepID=UPI0025C3751B|nr:GNAT family protein [Cecembia sp.]
MALDFDLVLEDEDILLRALQERDLPNLLELVTDKGLWNYFTFDLSEPKEFNEWLKPALEKERLQLVLMDKLTGKIVGSTALGNYAQRDQRIEIGWTWLITQYQGKGFNQKMKKLLLTYCFEKLKVERVEFKTDVLNLSARRALENINAIEEGVLRSHTLMTKNRRRDTIYYSILKEEWSYVKRENNW